MFEALGVARAEIRHSNFLAWLLSPGASHGQGDVFLRAVVTDILRKARAQDKVPAISPVEIDGRDLHNVEVRREWQNIDLLIVSRDPQFVIAVENKIDSGEHSNQLRRYEESVRREFASHRVQFVYLTKDGEDASDEDWVTYSYEDLHGALARAKRQAAGSLGGDVGVFLDHYLNLLGTRFMEDTEIAELCRRIRANHGRALDLIYQYTGGEMNPLLQAFADRVRAEFPHLVVARITAKDVRVVPKAWLEVLPPIGEGDERRAWLCVRFVARGDRCWLGVRTSGVTDTAVRNTVLRALVDPAHGLPLRPMFKNWEAQSRVMLAQHRVASWNEEEEPDVPGIVDKAVRLIPEVLGKLADVPRVISAALRSL